MSYYPIHLYVVTTPTSEKGSWANVDREAYPAPPHLPIPPNHSISEESGTPSRHNESFQPLSERASPTSLGEKPERPSFKCTECPTCFTQKQVLMRHYREKHQPGFECLEHACDHKWTQSRTYEYRKHLREEQCLEDDKIDKVLGPPRRRRGKGRAIESDPPPHFSPPLIDIKRDRQSPAEPQQRPLMQDANITTTEHEDSSGLDHLAALHARSRLFSKEDFALLGGYYKVHGRFRFPSVHRGGSTTADVPPNPGMLHVSALPSPVGGYHTSPVFSRHRLLLVIAEAGQR